MDILIFTGGIGENHAISREIVCKDMEFMGIEIDAAKNNAAIGEEGIISTPNSKVTVMVVPTDEEYTIASDTMEIVNR